MPTVTTPKELYQHIAGNKCSQFEPFVSLSMEPFSPSNVLSALSFGYTPLSQTVHFITKALTHERCPEGLSLSISIYGDPSPGMLEDGGCVKILRKAVVKSLTSALFSGRCKPGVTLDFSYLHLDSEDVIALSHAISNPQCPQRLHLYFYANPMGADGLIALANVLRCLHCPENFCLSIIACTRRENYAEDMEGFCAFAYGLGSGLWKPGISLDLSYNALSADVRMAFATALIRGGCPSNFSLSLNGDFPYAHHLPHTQECQQREKDKRQIAEAFAQALKSEKISPGLILSLRNLWTRWDQVEPILETLRSFDPLQLAQKCFSKILVQSDALSRPNPRNPSEMLQIDNEIQGFLKNARIAEALSRYSPQLNANGKEICALCYDEYNDETCKKTVFFPCAHLSCGSCASKWYATQTVYTCCFCRGLIKSFEVCDAKFNF